jgi:hypothetical protein
MQSYAQASCHRNVYEDFTQYFTNSTNFGSISRQMVSSQLRPYFKEGTRSSTCWIGDRASLCQSSSHRDNPLLLSGLEPLLSRSWESFYWLRNADMFRASSVKTHKSNNNNHHHHFIVIISTLFTWVSRFLIAVLFSGSLIIQSLHSLLN